MRKKASLILDYSTDNSTWLINAYKAAYSLFQFRVDKWTFFPFLSESNWRFTLVGGGGDSLTKMPVLTHRVNFCASKLLR